MQGLVAWAVQCFLRDTWGMARWQGIAAEAGVQAEGIEALGTDDPALTEAVLTVATRQLSLSRDALLEDLGTYLVSHPAREGIRRLLRFGGRSFDDFLISLEDLPARGRLALPDLALPAITVAEDGCGRFRLELRAPVPGVGHIAIGLLRAMADDYGTLAILSHEGAVPGGEAVSVQIAKSDFTTGRRFDLSAGR